MSVYLWLKVNKMQLRGTEVSHYTLFHVFRFSFVAAF
jgi:hypothetical protein